MSILKQLNCRQLGALDLGHLGNNVPVPT